MAWEERIRLPGELRWEPDVRRGSGHGVYAGGQNDSGAALRGCTHFGFAPFVPAESLRSLETPRTCLVAHGSGDRVLFAGGSSGAVALSSVERCALASRTAAWEVGSLSAGRSAAACGGNGQTMAVCGGTAGTGCLASLELIDLHTTARVIPEAVLTAARSHATGASGSACAIIAGGMDAAAGSLTSAELIRLPDCATAVISDCLLAAVGSAGCSAEGRVFFSGGKSGNQALSTHACMPADGSAACSSVGSLSVPRTDAVAGARGTAGVVLCGSSSSQDGEGTWSLFGIASVDLFSTSSPASASAFGSLTPGVQSRAALGTGD